MNPHPHALILLLLLSSNAGPLPAQTNQGLEDAIARIATELSQQMKNSQITKLAVVPFPDLNGYQSALGEFVAEELVTQLVVQEPGRFDIVERRQLAKVLEEQQLGTSSLFEGDNITKLGQILGVDAIITGSLADLGVEIKINARAVSVSTAKIFAAAAAKTPREGIAETLILQNPSVPSGDNITAQPMPQRSDVYFSNSFLRVGVVQVAKSEESRNITLALSLENLTTTDILIGMEMGSTYCRATLVDNLGNSFKLDIGTSGASGIACVYIGARKELAEYYTTLTARSKSTAVLTFRTDSKEVGTLYSFAGNFLRFEAGQTTKFSVGIGNIQLRR